MSTMNISLPETLKVYVEAKVQNGEYSTNSEYVKALIRKDLEREQLKNLLFAGAQSKPMADAVDKQYFMNLRNKSWMLKDYPYIVFYIESCEYIDVWRMLQAKTDIPNWIN